MYIALDQWLLWCGIPTVLIVSWAVLALVLPERALDQGSGAPEPTRSVGVPAQRPESRSQSPLSFATLVRSLGLDGSARKPIALVLVIYVSSSAFAGRDGAQTMKLDSENKRVARERQEPCELSGNKVGSETVAHVQRLFPPGQCGSAPPRH
jgi:hypothetical protein